MRQISQEGRVVCLLWETTGKSNATILSTKCFVEAGDTKKGRKLLKQKDNAGTITNTNI